MREFALQRVFRMKLVWFTFSSYTSHYIVKSSDILLCEFVLLGMYILAIIQI